MDTLRLLSRSSRLKVGKDRTDLQATQALPSAGGESHDEGQTSKKRKRDQSDDENPRNHLNESEIRQLQQLHKIKITDLRKLLKSSTNKTRKAAKEASRLFPQPLQSFKQLKDLGSNGALVGNVAEQAFKEPTEVQMATIPLLLGNGDQEPDLLTIAPTGSGKTLAFMIPLITKIAQRHQNGDPGDRQVTTFILAPTKELVGQIVNEGRKLSTNTGVRITEMRKGMRLHDDGDDTIPLEDSGSDSDASEDKDSPSGTLVKSDILVSTPLSLVHVLTSKNNEISRSFRGIQNLVLDEADVLLDPLFQEQTLAIWKACVSPELCVSLWSATIGASIEQLAISTIKSHHRACGSKSHRRPLIRTIIGLKDTSLPSISHRLTYASTESGKLMGLRQLLHPARSNTKTSTYGEKHSTTTITSASDTPLRPPFLIFTQTIARAQSLYEELQYDIPVSAGGSSRLAVLHSSLSSKQRSNTMTNFRQGKIWILITTDLLSRGVDFKGINGVVNYDIPTTAASYVHRAGRTGRAGRQGGIVVTLYTRDDVKYLKPIANIISASSNNSSSSSSNPEPSDHTNTTSSTPSTNGSTTTMSTINGLPAWLIPSLPDLTKSSRKDLKTRGVQERRAIKKSDQEGDRRRKLQNRIGTQSGYERKLQDRKRGMIQGSKRRARRDGNGDGGQSGGGDDDDDEGKGDFDGFGD